MNTFEKAQIKLMKDYIGYDKMIDDLVLKKEKQIIKAEIEILQLQQMKEGLINDIKRIRMEQDLSNLGNTLHYTFVDPRTEYYRLTKS